MWARLNDDNEIAQLYTRPIAVTLDGIQYPSSIFSLWSGSELQALNIWNVTMSNSPENQEWNEVSSPTYTVTKDGDDNVTGVTGTYTNSERPLKDVYAIPVSDSDGFSDGDKIASSATYSSAGKKGTIISKALGVLNVEITKGTWANGNTVRGFNSGGTALSPAVSTTISANMTLHSRGKQWDVTQQVKSAQKSKLEQYDWYYIRKADTAAAVPSAVQTYRDGVRTKADSLETAIAATTTIAELQAVDLGDGWPEELS
jgi:hypothetical protein